jgi:iron complex transport system ATP-binding protein
VSTPLVEVRGASFRYAERPIFEGLDLDVYAGEVLTVLGTNGCGKSTLLRCIGGSLSLEKGCVRIGDHDLSQLGPRAKAQKVGFLFQDHTPTFPFTVLEIALMGRTPHLGAFGGPSPHDTALAEAALEKVGILHLKSRPYTQLSGGERQLALLSRTLTQQPEVILLDEPTSHLDFKNQARCLQTIAGLAAQGITMIMTTHDPNHAFLFSGRVALMKGGAPLTVGPATQVITAQMLSATYGMDIGVYNVPRDSSRGDLKFCSAW